MNPFRSPRSHSPGRPPGKQPGRWRKALATVATVAIAASGLVGASVGLGAQEAQAAATKGLITSAGPLTQIQNTTSFTCAGLRNSYVGTTNAFYSASCYPVINVGANQFAAIDGGAIIPSASSSDQTFGGSGTAASPYWISADTVLPKVGSMPGTISFTRRDEYVVGQDAYLTTFTLKNNAWVCPRLS